MDVPRGVVSVHREPAADGSWACVATAGPGDQLVLPGTGATVPATAVLLRD